MQCLLDDPADIMIRKVEVKDLNVCCEVIQESFLPIAEKYNITRENSPNFTAFSISTDKLKGQYENGRKMFSYIYDDKIVGYYSLDIYDNECQLNNLCVLPEYQHLGIGKSLLNHAISFAKHNSLLTIKLSLINENQLLKEWYSSFGFQFTHKVKYDFFSFTCGYMEKKL